jgi:hypothetical protein
MVPESYLSEWKWLGFGTISKAIQVQNAAMTEGGDWGNRYHTDPIPPNETAVFQGLLLTLSEIMALRALAKTPLGEASVTTPLGQTWTGLIVEFDPNYYDGTEYFSCRLSLLNCTVTGP